VAVEVGGGVGDGDGSKGVTVELGTPLLDVRVGDATVS
jgi:hypothetical protein